MARPLDDPQAIRRAAPELLALALMDARNRLLALLALDEADDTALLLALHAGWWQEYWIARHVQRGRGEHCEPQSARLAGIEPLADAWVAGEVERPTPDELRHYLRDTLEITLDLLAALPADADDDALHFYRAALLHEDRLCEALAVRLQLGAPPALMQRPPVLLPARRWRLGSAPTAEPAAPGGRPVRGYVPHNERWAHEVAVPEFEIDAQPVSWSAYVEFADDGGYDRRDCWTDEGWAWLQREGRRAPQGVEQLHGGVVVQRASVGASGLQRQLQRAAGAEAVLHVSRHEAEAWCRWAGRRLPTEAEWELAAITAAGLGFVWGQVFEWTAGSARAWPGAGEPPPGELDRAPLPGHAVLRGASFATRSRWAHAKARRFAPAAHSTMFCGFRSCSVD
jgi:formylglycine-generating enzyme required for sulfatase activity